MSANGRKTAIIMIHGIGEQRPMDTLRSFADAVLSATPPPEGKQSYWSKPDMISGSFELRRLNAYTASRQPPIDFYEFYWAHLMEGTSIGHAVEWLNNLLLRWPAQVPAKLRRLWSLAWIILALAAAGLFYFSMLQVVGLMAALAGAILFAAKAGLSGVMRGWIGDAARYFNAKPHNIRVRQAIRAAGVDLLTKLHDSGEYRRIIIVGHSLGSVIALDILYHYWTKIHEQHNRPTNINQDLLKAFEAALNGETPPNTEQIMAFQKDVWREIRGLGVPWRITDLITLGSPLTHLPFLVGLNAEEFATRLTQREFSKSPPILDDKKISYDVDYTTDDNLQRTLAVLHHAACFGATRWSNIYFPHNGWLKGDPVGGPLAPLFGAGVQDIPVATSHWHGRLNHVDYWRDEPTDDEQSISPLKTLIRVLALGEDFKVIKQGKTASDVGQPPS